MIEAIAAMGDAGDINCWSGTPYHFGHAARTCGESAVAWRLPMKRFKISRPSWNFAQILKGRGAGGYQYSTRFLERAESAIPTEAWTGRIVTFNQHFPRASTVIARGARLAHYIDATFASARSPGGFAESLPAGISEHARAVERENFRSSEFVVTMARWVANSVVNDCGVPAVKVHTILPGANIALPAGYVYSARGGRPGRDRPLQLGFIGKDWKRKGLPFLLQVRTELERLGMAATVKCAGYLPRELEGTPGLEFAGFIDKAAESGKFLEFLAGCDVGCLFSAREPLGISTLEFLRAGVPVAGFMVEGIADTVPPDAGFRFEPGSSAGFVARTLHAAFSDEHRAAALRDSARAWSPLLTWERCVNEWRELLATGAIKNPVRPWTGHSRLS